MRICIPIVSETEEKAVRKMNHPLPEEYSLEILFELRVDRMREVKFEKMLGGKGEKNRGDQPPPRRRRRISGDGEGADLLPPQSG